MKSWLSALFKLFIILMAFNHYRINLAIQIDLINEPFASSKWQAVQEKVQNTVVQIIVMAIEFDWAQPYNTSKQCHARGSGFFINDKGLIVTNFHVISEAVAIWIHIPILGKELIGVEIVGTCPDRDVALLRIIDKDMPKVQKALGSIPYLSLGNSDSAYRCRAQKVLALGYPLGQESLKSTMGIISGFEHAGIQIDAAINGGNSGGPLLNERAEVIGINASRYDNAQNVNYAIPINELSSILPDLYHNKIVYSPSLGEISIYSNATLAEYKGNPETAGCYILKVITGSPTSYAGIQEGDMLASLDGYTIDKYGYMNVPWAEDPVSYDTYIRRLGIRDLLTVEYYRDGVLQKTTVNLAQSDIPAIVTQYPPLQTIDYEVIGGMVIMQLTLNHISLFQRQCECLKLYRLSDNKKEPVLVISHLFSNSLVGQSKLVIPGFTINTVNGIPVKTLEDFRQALNGSWQTGYLVMAVVDQQHGFSNTLPVIIPFDKALEETVQLAHLYHYPLSTTINTLLEKSGQSFNSVS